MFNAVAIVKFKIYIVLCMQERAKFNIEHAYNKTLAPTYGSLI